MTALSPHRYDGIALGIALAVLTNVLAGMLLVQVLRQPSGTILLAGAYQVLYVAPLAWFLAKKQYRRTTVGLVAASGALLLFTATLVVGGMLGFLQA